MVTIAWLGIKLYSGGFRRTSGVVGKYELFEKEQPNLGSMKVFLVDHTEASALKAEDTKALIEEGERQATVPFGGPVLFLILSSDPSHSEPLFSGSSRCSFWIVDAARAELVTVGTFEDSFEGLKSLLSDALKSRIPEAEPVLSVEQASEPVVSISVVPEEFLDDGTKEKKQPEKREKKRVRRRGPSQDDFLRFYILRINFALILINVLVFFINAAVNSAIPMISPHLGALAVADLFVPKYYYHFFTAAFVHFGLQHLLGNMASLFFIGPLLEDALGKWKYLLTYLVSAVLANLLSILVYLASGRTNVITAGASGAVFAVMGGVLAAMLLKRIQLKGESVSVMAVVIIVQLVSGFLGTKGVNNSAHIVGAVIGFAVSISILAIEDHFQSRKERK